MTTTPNTELILDVLAQIERDPDSWRQADWGVKTACGTAYCFAGWAAVLSGYELAWRQDDEREDTQSADRVTAGPRVKEVAAALLGVPWVTGFRLFHYDNSLDDLYDYCAAILDLDAQVLRDKVQDRVTQ